jgi:hypothetical protein
MVIVQFLDKSGKVTACHVTGLLNECRAVGGSIVSFLARCTLTFLLSRPQKVTHCFPVNFSRFSHCSKFAKTIQGQYFGTFDPAPALVVRRRRGHFYHR